MTKRSTCIDVRDPFPWPHMLSYLAARATPGVEQIAGGAFKREGVAVTFENAQLVVRGGAAADVARVRSIFTPDYDGGDASATLRRDRILRDRIDAVPGFRPLGAWSAFELCIRTIIGQQVSVAGARTLTARLVERAGRITPAEVAQADFEAIGMPGARVRTIRTFAEHVASGDLSLDQPWPALDDALAHLPGFGPWTRAYLGIRLGRDADSFPASDLGLIRAVGAGSPRELAQRAERWRPFRGIAATYLWAVDP